MIIIIAISSIAALIFPSNELVNAIRFYKISILLLSAFFGDVYKRQIHDMTSFCSSVYYVDATEVRKKEFDHFISVSYTHLY